MYYNYIYHSVYAFVIIYQYIYKFSCTDLERERCISILCTFKDTYVSEIPCRDVTLAKRAKKQTIKIRDKKGFPGGAPGIIIIITVLLL